MHARHIYLLHYFTQENDTEKSNMTPLLVVREYDDMKQQVRDGAKKVRVNGRQCISE